MIRKAFLAGCYLLAATMWAQDKVNPGAATLKDFEQRVTDYVKLHKAAQSKLAGMKPTDSQKKLEHQEAELARTIREERRGAVPGNIFTPEIAAEFRRLIADTMHSPQAGQIRQSLQHAEPVRLSEIRVNRSYPTAVPLQSTPPTLLMNLPQLPPELDYRVVGQSLILRDVGANLIVDFISKVIP